jgi:N utilization substance protein B
MQALYAIRSGVENSQPEPGGAAAIMRKKFDETLGLFIWQIWFLTEVALYADQDSRQRSAKNLPTPDDLNVPKKIFENELLHRIRQSPLFEEGVAKYKPQLTESGDWVRKVYHLLYESTPYAVYNAQPGRDKKAEREILEFIFTDLMLANDDLVSFVEDLFPNWDDDADMLRLLIEHYLQKPGTFRLSEMIGQEKFEFATQLLYSTESKRAHLDEIIKPKLRNWDSERLALLDTILLEMGVCEFLYFETIPPKVTINEYIDLAKEYSTSQSGQFVNGILDNVRKDLEAQGRLQKVAYKK